MAPSGPGRLRSIDSTGGDGGRRSLATRPRSGHPLQAVDLVRRGRDPPAHRLDLLGAKGRLVSSRSIFASSSSLAIVRSPTFSLRRPISASERPQAGSSTTPRQLPGRRSASRSDRRRHPSWRDSNSRSSPRNSLSTASCLRRADIRRRRSGVGPAAQRRGRAPTGHARPNAVHLHLLAVLYLQSGVSKNCISQLPSSPRAASLAVDGSPCPPGVSEPVSELGAPSTRTLSNPNSRQGRLKASPYSQGRVMEQSSSSTVFVGIDVAKSQLDVHARPAGETFAVSRDGAGLAALTERLAGLAPRLIVLEATGGFEATVAATLSAAGLPLVVVNPRQIRDFARATGRLAKTDRLDAEAIARFAEAVQPEPRPLPDEAARHLGELVARRRQIVESGSALPPAARAKGAASCATPSWSAASMPIWSGCTRSWPASKPISATRSATAPPGAPPRSCWSRSRASARPRPACSLPSCPSSAGSIGARSPAWSASPRSTATAAPSAAAA